MEMSGQLHKPAAQLPWKEPHVPIDRRLGGPQSLAEHVTKNPFPS
jgi:hypothetical protein